MNKKKLTVKFNKNNLPYLKKNKNTFLNFSIKDKTLYIEGNKKGLKLLAKALYGMSEYKKNDGYHIHIDDLYDINKDNHEIIISKIE